MRGCWGINSKLLLKGWLLTTGLQWLALNMFNHTVNYQSLLDRSTDLEEHPDNTWDSTQRGRHTEWAHQACRPLALYFPAAAYRAPLCQNPELSLCFSNLKSENANKRQNTG